MARIANKLKKRVDDKVLDFLHLSVQSNAKLFPASLQMKTVIVVGAGLAGLTAAAHLAKSHRVLIIEKKGFHGGRACSVWRKGFRFDLGASLYMMPNIIDSVYHSLGTSAKKELNLLRCDPLYKLVYPDNTAVDVPAKLRDFVELLEELEPWSGEKFRKFYQANEKTYNLLADHLMNQPFDSVYTVAKTIGSYEHKAELIKSLFTSIYTRVSKIVSEPMHRLSLSFQVMYLGMSPTRAMAAYAILGYTELSHGVLYPKGGMGMVADSLLRIAKRRGATIRYNSNVERVLIKNGKAVGVFVDGKEVFADVVVVNAPLIQAVRNQVVPRNAVSRDMLRMKTSCSTVSFYFGLKRRLPELEMHNLFFVKDFKKNLNDIFYKNKTTTDPCFYVHVPSQLDRSALSMCRRRRGEVMVILIPVSNLRKSRPDYHEIVKQLRRTVLNRIEKYTGRKIRKSIVYEKVHTPLTWENEFGLEHGGITGATHNLRQMLCFRPHLKSPKYEGLYFCGADCQPGTGVPLVMTSGKMVSDMIAS
jgi:phytoene desaturase (3,4-didehydrolycopene-forming)